LSSSLFSVLTVASAAAPAPPPVPVVTPGAAFAPDDCAVPRLFVPGGGTGELTTPLLDPAELPLPPLPCPVLWASDATGIAAMPQITIKALIETVAGDPAIGDSPLGNSLLGKSPLPGQRTRRRPVPELIPSHPLEDKEATTIMRKLIAFDDDTFDKLKQLGRDRMATFQELADEAFADLLKKHGIPIDLRDALRKSARLDGASDKTTPRRRPEKARRR
jgi:hypothetical protein